MSKKLQAWEVLADARFALSRLHPDAEEQEQRVLWFALIGLLRAVGHVLDKVDAPADANLRRRVDAWWPAAQCEPIFRDFIEKDRNQFLKTYQPMPRQAVLLTDDGRVLLTDGGSPIITSQRFVMEGPFRGKEAAWLANEALVWWERQLTALTA